MSSLRNRLAALLIVAIVTVVGLATLAASRVLQPPVPETAMQPMARQLALLATLAERDQQGAAAIGVVLQSGPAAGTEIAGYTAHLLAAMKAAGLAHTVLVTQAAGSPYLLASVKLGTGNWLVAPISDFRPPPGGWWILAGWSALIVLGSTVVSVFAATKITKPLELLEDAIGRVGPDGALEPIPETGPGEIRVTARAINALSGRLRSAMESRMRLVAAAGHDLRTPMTRMRLRAEFIADDEERQKWLADLAELEEIADSAISLVREEARGRGGELVDLGPLVSGIVGELAQLGHRVSAPALPTVRVAGDSLALKRALRNLITNAATHGGGGGIGLVRDGNMAVVTIRDYGPGIPEELLDRVFEPLFRVDTARRKLLPGAGLGLAIAKEIVERHGGTIRMSNCEDPPGLLQVVKLPLAS